MQLPSVVTIAGSDSSGGAGIQADLKTMAALGLYGQSVITALTAQNTCGVRSVQQTEVAIVADQIDAVFEDIRPAATKIGMLSSAPIAHAVAEGLRRHDAGHVVLDPVMVATSGAALMEQGAAPVMVGELFGLAEVVTPNIPEASALAGFDVAAHGLEGMVQAARSMAQKTPGAVLVKGGHLLGAACATDVLLLPGQDEPRILEGEFVEAAGTHGTGCTLSSAIACYLALGCDVESAVRRAKAYLTRCLAAGLDMGTRNGPLDHMAALRWAIPRIDAAPVPACQAEAPASGDLQPGAAPGDRGAAIPAHAPSCQPCDDETCEPYALVVSGSPCAPSPDLLARQARGARLVVAVDSGANACMGAGVPVDVLVGDGDSLSAQALAYARACNARELDFPMDKDDTDLGLALGWVQEHAAQLAVESVRVLGALGGRPDHELAALGVLARVQGLPVDVLDESLCVYVLCDHARTRLDLPAEALGSTLSVVAPLGPAQVSESGMRWNLDHATLSPLDDLGVSNVVASRGACVEVHEGCVLVVLLRDRIEKGSVLKTSPAL